MGDGGQLGQADLAVQMLVDVADDLVQLRHVLLLDGLTGLFPIDIIVVADNLGKNGLQLDFHEQLVAGALLPEFLHNLHHKGKNAAGGGSLSSRWEKFLPFSKKTSRKL